MANFINESMISQINQYESTESVNGEAPPQDEEVNIFEADSIQNNAIKKTRFSKYRLSNPGFFATFENQAEVYEMLVHDEI